MSSTFTAEEVGSFRTLRSILDHISVPQIAEQAFLTAVGGADTMMPKALGIIPAEEFESLISGVRITEGSDEPRKLRFAERGMLLLVGVACRACAGLSGPSSTLAVSNPRNTDHPMGQVPPSVALRKIKLSHVLKQGDDTEIPLVAETLMAAGYARWQAIFGLNKRPRPEEDITIEQSTCIKHLLDSDSVPYADFCIWGPYGHRTERKLKLEGQVLNS